MSSSPHKHDFLPARQLDLLAWSRNFRDYINSPTGPEQYGLTFAQATHYSALHDAYAAAIVVAGSKASNTSTSIVAKNNAKKALKADARMLARIIRAAPGVTDEQKKDLGLTIADAELTPVSRPADPPEISMLPSLGQSMRIRLRDKAAPTRKGKPPGMLGAVIMSYIGESVPQSMAGWSFQGIATRRFFNVRFDAEAPAGAKVWIAAAWFNTRGQLGPASTAISARINEGIAATLRLAA